MTEDDPRTIAMIEEIRRELRGDVQKFKRSLCSRLQSLQDSMDKGFATIRDEEAWNRRLENLKLPADQELLIYELMTLPKEAILLLLERYRELLRQEH